MESGPRTLKVKPSFNLENLQDVFRHFSFKQIPSHAFLTGIQIIWLMKTCEIPGRVYLNGRLAMPLVTGIRMLHSVQRSDRSASFLRHIERASRTNLRFVDASLEAVEFQISKFDVDCGQKDWPNL